MAKTNRLAHLEGKKLYTLTELEGLLGCTHRTLLTYVKTGKLHAVKIGNKWKVSEETLTAFLNGETETDKAANGRS